MTTETEVDWVKEAEKCAKRLSWTDGHTISIPSSPNKTNLLQSCLGWCTPYGFCTNDGLSSFVYNKYNLLAVIERAGFFGWDVVWLDRHISFAKRKGVDGDGSGLSTTTPYPVQEDGTMRAVVLAFNDIPYLAFKQSNTKE